jgi:hypothetical protein
VPAASNDPTRSLDLRLERSERLVCDVARHASALQVVPDEGVSGAASRESFCPPLGITSVVEKPGSAQGRHGLVPLALQEPAGREATVELGDAQVTMPERSKSGVQSTSWLRHEVLGVDRRGLVYT